MADNTYNYEVCSAILKLWVSNDMLCGDMILEYRARRKRGIFLTSGLYIYIYIYSSPSPFLSVPLPSSPSLSFPLLFLLHTLSAFLWIHLPLPDPWLDTSSIPKSTMWKPQKRSFSRPCLCYQRMTFPWWVYIISSENLSPSLSFSLFLSLSFSFFLSLFLSLSLSFFLSLSNSLYLSFFLSLSILFLCVVHLCTRTSLHPTYNSVCMSALRGETLRTFRRQAEGALSHARRQPICGVLGEYCENSPT